MDFDFDLTFLKSDKNGISVWNGEFRSELSAQNLSKYIELIDEMGRASCKAQGLGQPVTSGFLLHGTNHTLYLISHENKVKGILKIGYKKLFIHEHVNLEYVEMTPLCVLDFYVHESCQRRGIGKLLFQYMLKSQDIEPRLLAYDAPSQKLLNFLDKYYGLKVFTPQNCKFVIYHDYFNPTDTYHYQPFISQHDVCIPHSSKDIDDEQQEEEQEIIENAQNSEHSSKNINDKIVENEQKAEEKIDDNNNSQCNNNKNMLLTLQYKPDSHQKQMDWIQKQIEKTKIEISESEAKIYKHHLENNISPYSVTHPRNKKSLQIRNIHKSAL